MGNPSRNRKCSNLTANAITKAYETIKFLGKHLSHLAQFKAVLVAKLAQFGGILGGASSSPMLR